MDCWAVRPLHLKQTEGCIPLGYFCHEQWAENKSSSFCFFLETSLLLIWGSVNIVVGIFLSVSVVCRHLCDWVESWMWAGAVDLGELPSGNRSASCIDFYFHGWVIWVPALQSQLGYHQGQLGRQGICFCLHQFHALSRYRCVVWIFLSTYSICRYILKLCLSFIFYFRRKMCKIKLTFILFS